MSQSDLDQLLDQLFFDDVKIRRNAAQRLGELGRPEAIADLVNVYNKDADPGVRKAAGDALRVFRRMEQQMLGTIPEEEQASGPDLGPILGKARLGLIVLLAITVFVNAAVLIGKAIPVAVEATPTLAAPTARNTLVEAFKARIENVRTEATALRGVISGIQGMGMNGVKQDECQKFGASTLDKVDIDPLDARTYPDLRAVADAINIPALKIVTVRNNYMLLCGTKTQADFDKVLAGVQDGVAGIVTRIDGVINKDLPVADALLKKAIDQPAPTVGPTATVTPTFTPTIPTATPTVPPTVTPIATETAAAPTVAAGSTGAATSGGVATEAPTIAAQGSYTLNGLGLEQIASYKYRVIGTTTGTYPSNKTFRGSMTFLLQKQNTPLQAQYEVTINEGNPNNAFFKAYLPTLYAQGSSVFVLVNDTLYETGSVLEASKFNGRCRASSATAQNTARLQDFTFGNLSDFPLTMQAGDAIVNGEKTVHYHGERVQGESGELYQILDVFVSAKSGTPVQIMSVRMLNPKADAATKAKSGLKDFIETITYDLLAQQVAVDVLKPAICQ